MMVAIKRNIGTAISADGSMPPIICWIMISGFMPEKNTKKPSIDAPISGISIGKPSSSMTSMSETIESAISGPPVALPVPQRYSAGAFSASS